MVSRRQLIKQSLCIAVLSHEFGRWPFGPGTEGKKFRIGACDWSLDRRTDIRAFDLAREIGLEGIMVDMGTSKDNLPLRQKEWQDRYLQASVKTAVQISSIAIGELNNVPYKSDPQTEQWVWDSVDTAKYLKVPVVLLAFFNRNDLRGDETGKKEVIRRLRAVSPHAEKNGVILGIESYLDAREHLEIIDSVGSPNIKVYYDFRNTADAGHDTIAEFKKIGRDLICELHMKENGFQLGKGTLDWPNIARAIYDTGYYGDGWMQIEWARSKEAGLVESYRENHQFLKNLFSKTTG